MTVRIARRPGAAVAAVLAIATATVAAGLLRRQPLSWDEAVTAAIASRPVPSVLGTLAHSDAVLGAYYLLVHGWSELVTAAGARMTEVWWRLPSALAAVGTCVVAAVVARRLAGDRAALFAGGLLAVLPLFAFYALDARPYTLAALAVTGAWAVWTRRAATVHPLRDATFVVPLLVVGAWLQLFTVLVWPAFVLVRGRRGAVTTLWTVALAALGVLPLLTVALRQSAEIAWIAPASAANTASVVAHVAGGFALVALLLVLAVAARRAGLVRASATTAAFGWWIGAPLFVLAMLDLVRPVLVARYALVSLPLVAVATAVVVTRATHGRSQMVVRALGVATVAVAVVTTVLQTARPWKYEDYRGAAAFAARSAPAGTPVLFAPSSSRLGFDLYAGPARLHDVALPGGVGADPLAIAENPAPLLREAVSGRCRVVVVGDPLDVATTARTPSDRAKLAVVAGWQVVTQRGFGAISVTLLERPTCTKSSNGTALSSP